MVRETNLYRYLYLVIIVYVGDALYLYLHRFVATASGRSIKVFSSASGQLLQEHFHHDCKV